MGLFSNIGSIIADEYRVKSPAITTVRVKSEFEETNDYIAELQRKIDADKPRTAKQIQQDTAGGSVIYLKAIGEKIGITFSEQFLAECGKLELQPEEIVTIAEEFKGDGFSNTPSIKDLLNRGMSANRNADITSAIERITSSAVLSARPISIFKPSTWGTGNSQCDCLVRAVRRLNPDYSDEQVNNVLDEWRKKLDQ